MLRSRTFFAVFNFLICKFLNGWENENMKMKANITKLLKNALEIADQGGAVMASEWTTGSGRHVSKRAVPEFCREVFTDNLDMYSGKGYENASRLFKAHPRCRKMIVVHDWPALMVATKDYRAAMEIKVAKEAAQREREQSAAVEKLAEAVARAKAVEPASIDEWRKRPVHPAPADIMAAKIASGLSWSDFERAA